MCSTRTMRWQGLDRDSQGTLPGLAEGQYGQIPGLVRTCRPPEFAGVAFHEVLAKSVLNRVAKASRMPFNWSINPYRGCTHACTYCFARGSHRYLDLDTGADFDSQIIVKVNAPQVLKTELSKPSWTRRSVALGTNTDPYQRAEGRYRLMPGIIDALVDSGTPFSILTKGTLVRRDFPRLLAAQKRVPCGLSMSVAMLDPDLQRSAEPGTPSAQARLETIAAATDAGLAVDVFVMPLLPYLTDSLGQLLPLLKSIREAGANSVAYAPLHLRKHVKPWFMQWLGEAHPDLVAKYERLYPGTSSTVTSQYKRELAGRVVPLIQGLGLGKADLRAARAPVAVRDVPVLAGVSVGENAHTYRELRLF